MKKSFITGMLVVSFVLVGALAPVGVADAKKPVKPGKPAPTPIVPLPTGIGKVTYTALNPDCTLDSFGVAVQVTNGRALAKYTAVVSGIMGTFSTDALGSGSTVVNVPMPAYGADFVDAMVSTSGISSYGTVASPCTVWDYRPSAIY